MIDEARYDVDAELARYKLLAARLAPHVVDGPTFLSKALEDKKRILVEGANALMLDLDFGTYPFVTSSPTGIGGVLTGLGLPPSRIGEVFGVVKAYTTRVGAGPFPTEQLNVRSLMHLPALTRAQDVGVHMQEVGQEFGVTTGRRRRCGWLDLVVLKYSHLINDYTALNLTKLDILDQLPVLKIAVAYHLDGKKLDRYFPADLSVLDKVEVEYVELEGWMESIEQIKTYDALPQKCREYVEFIEKFMGVRVGWIGVGPGRESMIIKS